MIHFQFSINFISMFFFVPVLFEELSSKDWEKGELSPFFFLVKLEVLLRLSFIWAHWHFERLLSKNNSGRYVEERGTCHSGGVFGGTGNFVRDLS